MLSKIRKFLTGENSGSPNKGTKIRESCSKCSGGHVKPAIKARVFTIFSTAEAAENAEFLL
jgi:hypothetical protein